jgi:hypothetical protein
LVERARIAVRKRSRELTASLAHKLNGKYIDGCRPTSQGWKL